MSKFGELISAQVPVLIDFTDWNESSVSMHPVIRDVAALGDKAKSLRLMWIKPGISRCFKLKDFLLMIYKEGQMIWDNQVN
jgi:thioredoxin 1